MKKVYLALGSNLENPFNQVKTAIEELGKHPHLTVIRHSSLYLNPPLGKLDQPEFINAVLEAVTTLPAHDLLALSLLLEANHQRHRVEKNGPRTLDVDILLYGNEIIDTDSLQIPHPRLHERSFAVLPLAEIAPELVLPCGTSIQHLVKNFNPQSLIKLTMLGEKCE
ncbi:MAG: 2-amino-4-hydroxy-6-hydroxymethyldihydropteridine diphosphokinase [Gammaproteobacteria bacterium]|nr:2-amino-4-hydroxy-6-hydroxymethyldihydropteridine diphosphokinase [Gammaproteobacteria bacterium]